MSTNRSFRAGLLAAGMLSLAILAAAPSGTATANPGGRDGLTQSTDPSYTSVGVSCNGGSCPQPQQDAGNPPIDFP